MTITLEDIEEYIAHVKSQPAPLRSSDGKPAWMPTLHGFVQWMRSKEKTE